MSAQRFPDENRCRLTYIRMEVTGMQNIDEKTVRKVVPNLGAEQLVSALPQYALRKALALVSRRKLAQMLGLHESTLRWHRSKGRIPRPTKRLQRRAYYSQDEAEAIAHRWKTEKFSWRKTDKSGQKAESRPQQQDGFPKVVTASMDILSQATPFSAAIFQGWKNVPQNFKT